MVVAEAQIPVGLVRSDHVLGIDEAGRGAVLGPLVVAGVMLPRTKLAHLSQLEARDSKSVPREKRKGLLAEIARDVKIRVIVISARAVDGENLTQLELQAASNLIRRFRSSSDSPTDRHPLPITVVMDAPVSPRALGGFRDRLAQRCGLPKKELQLYPRADALHPAVGAASLAAKVVRDAYVTFLREKYGDFGWGYPGEKRVQEFLKEWLERHGEFPEICRTRWRAAQRLLRLQLFPQSPSDSR